MNASEIYACQLDKLTRPKAYTMNFSTNPLFSHIYSESSQKTFRRLGTSPYQLIYYICLTSIHYMPQSFQSVELDNLGGGYWPLKEDLPLYYTTL